MSVYQGTNSGSTLPSIAHSSFVCNHCKKLQLITISANTWKTVNIDNSAHPAEGNTQVTTNIDSTMDSGGYGTAKAFVAVVLPQLCDQGAVPWRTTWWNHQSLDGKISQKPWSPRTRRLPVVNAGNHQPPTKPNSLVVSPSPPTNMLMNQQIPRYLGKHKLFETTTGLHSPSARPQPMAWSAPSCLKPPASYYCWSLHPILNH